MDSRARFPWWLILVNGVIAFAITVGTIEFWHARFDDQSELRMLRLVYRQVLRDHVEPHDAEEVQRGAIDWLMGQLDEYSAFVPPDKASAFDSETTGEYQGIGIVAAPRTAPLTVHALFEGGPAERAGLAVGDRILRIDGESLADLPPERVVAEATRRLLGPPGSTVTLQVERAAGGTGEVVITRGAVQRKSVKWVRLLDAEARIGYLYIAAFQQRTAAEVDAALQQLADEAGGRLAGLVLDLRRNPGGLLHEAVAVTNRFVASGNIVTLRARGVEQGRHDADPRKATHRDLPLVVLVDHESASASEVVSGALQDHGRALLVGQRTFGKGAVQSIYRWEGLDFRLKLTTSHYHTPSGRSIGPGKGGIVPDVEVALDDEVARRLAVRLAQHEVPRRYKEAAAELGRKLGFVSEHEQLGPDEDAQLGRALAELRRKIAAPDGKAR
ncbi:MAG TPA: S41 family peptidase [Planctomycetota bacterium]|nr:S41 family peptidase [Planctomycetota bacterium]